MNCLSPSILSADYCNLQRDIQTADDAGAQYIHIDVMDGHFVPSITVGAPVVRSIRNITDKILDVHLMVERPERMISDFIDAGADIITVHAESTNHLDRVIRQIKAGGAMASVAVNPSTPLSVLDYILPEVDMVLVMSVNPGYGGQKFIPYILDKLRDLQAILYERHLKTDVEVDGGVRLDNLDAILEAGANVIVSGSAIFHGDISENIAAFLEKM
ncbi:MAG: ribulose-phosphate 3-epimerase [Lachnospiraceae bacterium]|nr:ribulose-phosphate 3-epimerase [Lachnospiraceae bacterium]